MSRDIVFLPHSLPGPHNENFYTDQSFFILQKYHDTENTPWNKKILCSQTDPCFFFNSSFQKKTDIYSLQKKTCDFDLDKIAQRELLRHQAIQFVLNYDEVLMLMSANIVIWLCYVCSFCNFNTTVNFTSREGKQCKHGPKTIRFIWWEFI